MRLGGMTAALFTLCALAMCARADYALVWSDEFDRPQINPENWTHEVFPGAQSGNNELQHYTDRSENSFIEDGCLVINARKEEYKNYRYTSARLKTQGKHEFLYGKVEARIKLPAGQGMWPAFWMMPAASAYGTWAASGEIDILEAINVPDHVFGTLHFGGAWPGHVFQGARYEMPKGAPDPHFSHDFHVYTLEWQPYEMRWYVDGNLYGTQHDWYTSNAPYPAPFDQAFYIILNVAVGAHLAGPPDETTPWPQRMTIDWVRVYQTGNKPPNLEVVSPVAGARVAADTPVVVEAKVDDPDGDPVTVEIYNGDTLLTKLTEAPWQYRWAAADGLYNLRVRALDDRGFARNTEVEVVKGKGVPRQPYKGVAAKVPGTIEAEDFDEGMPGDACQDFDKVNHGKEYRPGQPVDIQKSSEGGFNLCWVEDGEWVAYTVEVAEAGNYVPSFRVASPNETGRFRLEVAGGASTVVGAPRTGDWQKYETVEAEPLAIEKGRQTLRLTVEKGGANITSFSLRAAGEQPNGK